MATPDYGEINPRFTIIGNRAELQIDSPPERVLMSIRALHGLPHECVKHGGNLLYAGVDFRSPGREHVRYEVVGWDADRKALILHREAS